MGQGDNPELADTQADSLSAPASPTGELPRGTAIGRYLVLGVLGAGGMGVVYAAYDPELDRKVALKLVRRAAGSGADSGGRARMLREAQGIAKLSHPNVVAVHDVGTHDDEVFVAMELVDGDNLTRWLKAETRSTGAILDVMVQAGRGLAAAHRAGLVHRDFKPDNVLVGRDGRARVVDFGLVRRADREDAPKASSSTNLLATELTQAGALMGTPAYMAPEQFSDGIADARSDQYAFCMSLYEALYGRRPYDGKDLGELSGKAMTGKLDKPAATRKVEPHVRLAIRRGLSTDPTGRFATMDDLLAELARDAAARRRRWAIAGGMTIAIGAAAIVPWLVTRGGRAEQVSCDDGRASFAVAWNPERRDALAKAFGTTRLPFAADLTAGIIKDLDAYADRWARSYEESCKATYVRGEQTEQMHEARLQCLTIRRSEVAAVVDVLTRADASAIATAHTAVGQLPQVIDCDNTAGMLVARVADRTPAVQQEYRALEGELGRARAAFDVERYAEAARLAEPLVARARKHDLRGLEALAASTLGQARYAGGDLRGAREPLRAAFVAGVASGDEGIATAAAIRLGAALGASGELEEGRYGLAVAEAYGQKWQNPAVLAQVQIERGRLFIAESKYAEAATELEHALARSDDPEAILDILAPLALCYDELGRYADAQREGERALAIVTKRLGPKHPVVVRDLITLGNTADDGGDRAAATRYYERALGILDADPTSAVGQRATVLTNLGVIAHEEHRDDDARADFQRALGLREAEDADGPEVALVLTNLGGLDADTGHCADAEPRFTRSIAIVDKRFGADHPYIGDALVGLGQCQLEAKQIDAALAGYTRALAIRQAGARPTEVAEAGFGLAKAQWAHGDHAKAVDSARAARSAIATTPTASEQVADIDKWLRDVANTTP